MPPSLIIKKKDLKLRVDMVIQGWRGKEHPKDLLGVENGESNVDPWSEMQILNSLTESDLAVTDSLQQR